MDDLDLTVPRCDANTATLRVGPGGYGLEPVQCAARRGLTSFRDHQGRTRYACGASGHAASVVRRFGVMEAEPDWSWQTVPAIDPRDGGRNER